ncbi:hypothetical protein PR003_g18666 [Phytophthora rubi]|uniref:Uncharacterized protein n=1 Tax=Phytophthora rubi TaxID=129364 RepID=A0A6A3KCP5_9STRA|nr:hypothetical protein PR002_g17800 [Phytophthora rubi]KAE9005186.1 hypothetical protein PR001_g17517 [Phytophthora rubi]KAE9316642.1 hypothetical protein PR003_g18666 [Phytophthora rubi]
MGMFPRVVLPLVLCIVLYDSFAIGASEIEVALGPDGSVIDENRPVETVARDPEDANGGAMQQKVASGAEPMKMKDAMLLQQENNVVTVMTTLQEELVAVQQMVTLQEKKLQVLEQMRSVWLQEHQEVKETEDMEVVKRKSRTDTRDVIERRLDAAVAESVAQSTAKHFSTYFIERLEIALDGQVANMKMMKLRTSSATELIAVAYTAGIVVFYTSEEEELLRVDTGRHGIKSIALETQDLLQPCLVVTYETPVVAIYELNIVEKGVAGGNASSDEDKTKSDPLLPMTISISPEVSLSTSEHRDLPLSAKASAVAFARSSRQVILAVAEANGIIDFFSRNGTMLRQIQTNASITAMETNRNLLAFSNGTALVISSMTRAQGSVFHACPGSSAKISSIAFDAVHPEIIYAGTQRGEILVYLVNAGVSGGSQVCRLLSRLTVQSTPRDQTPLALAVTKSYVIATGPQDIAVFNVSKTQKTGVSLSRLCMAHLNDRLTSAESRDEATLPAVSFSEGVTGSHFAFVTAGIGGQPKLILFHSLLPQESESSDFQWTTFIYAGVMIVAVVVSQLFVRWQKQTSVNPWDSVGKTRDSPYGKYGGFKGHNHTDFDGEDFSRYNSLSDELRRKISQAKRGSAQRPIDDEADY